MTRIWEFPFTKFIIINRNCCKVDNWSVVMMSSRQSSDIQQSQGPHLQRLAKQERNIRQVEEPDNLSGPEAEGCLIWVYGEDLILYRRVEFVKTGLIA